VIVVTTPFIEGRRVVKTLGIVRGSTVRATHIGRDIMAVLRNIVGGEVEEYTKMLAESREQALDRMMSDAKKLGANAVVGAFFSTSNISAGTAEILIFGTAVIVEAEPAGESGHCNTPA
jgi:uncharacterized protein YbjQ (UPF0145 family)